MRNSHTWRGNLLPVPQQELKKTWPRPSAAAHLKTSRRDRWANSRRCKLLGGLQGIHPFGQRKPQESVYDNAFNFVLATVRTPHYEPIEIGRRDVLCWSTTHAALHSDDLSVYRRHFLLKSSPRSLIASRQFRRFTLIQSAPPERNGKPRRLPTVHCRPIGSQELRNFRPSADVAEGRSRGWRVL